MSKEDIRQLEASMVLRTIPYLFLLACLDKAAIHPEDYDDDDDGERNETGTDSADDDSDGDGYSQEEDCDDSDPSVHPGASEICDGKDNDCQPETVETGIVSWIRNDGSVADLSAEFAAGGQSNPISWETSEEGELHLCGSGYYASLHIGHSVLVQGHNEGPDPVLSTVSQGSIIDIQGTGLSVEIADLRLIDGQGSFASIRNPGVSGAGGGIACAGPNTLVARNLALSRNSATVGGAIYLEECTLEGSGLILTDNIGDNNGGGIFALDAVVTLSETEIVSNTSTRGTGGLVSFVDGATPLLVRLEDTLLESNTGLHGGAYLSGTKLECAGSPQTRSGFLGNTGTGSDSSTGGVYLDSTSQVVSQSCDWGETGTTEDNSPADTNTSSTNHGDDASFVENGS